MVMPNFCKMCVFAIFEERGKGPPLAFVPKPKPSICPNSSYLTDPPQACEISDFWPNWLEFGVSGMTTKSPNSGGGVPESGSIDTGSDSEESGPEGSGSGEPGPGDTGLGSGGSGSTETGSGEHGSGGPGSTKPGSGNPDDSGTVQFVNVDFEREAEFLKIFMDLDEDVRKNIGHRIGKRMSDQTQTEVQNMIKTCVFKGETCIDKK